jgi:dimethylhistidine N-methyltransferase
MNGSVLSLDFAETADREEFRRAVLRGLFLRPRAIPAKFLYDARGSTLFDEICELPEYYLTRTETAILERHAGEIGHRVGAGCALIEFGSGSSVKSRLLIEALSELALYAPIDISREHLDATAARLRRDYPKLRVLPVCADFMGPVPEIESSGRRLGFFPGSTIGNLTPAEARAFLSHARELLGDDGALVLGVDLRKDPQRLHDAYNDSSGVTAAFTLNLLRRMNRELHANFDLAAFAHEAFYDEAEGRIEIYIRSLREQSVSIAGQRFDFAAGERIHTEYSYKYDTATLLALAESGGFRVGESWTDPEHLFAVVYLESTPQK